MSFTIESLIIAIFAVLPDFVSAAIRATLKPGQTRSAGEWVAGSIVASLFLNSVAFLIFIFLFQNIDLSKPLSELKNQLFNQTGRTALEYLACLYLVALTWGFASGLTSERVQLRVLAYRFRLTPISPTPNVFTDVLAEHIRGEANRGLSDDDPKRQVAWLRVRRDRTIIQGRVRKTSVHFSVNEPIEVFLSPAFIFESSAIVERPIRPPGAEYMRGMYLRLRPDDIADVLVAPASWMPIPHPPIFVEPQAPAAPLAAKADDLINK